MKKPTWLKKDDKSKPWKYKKDIPDGKGGILVCDMYNFTLSIFGHPTAEEYLEAIKWIDEQMDKKS